MAITNGAPARFLPSQLAPNTPSLAAVLSGIVTDKGIPPARRNDTASALRTIGRALGKPLDALPAHPGYLREQLHGFAPAMIGMEGPRWRNVMSLLRSALKHAGLAHVPARHTEPMTPDWAALFGLFGIDDRRMRRGLSRLARYCGARGIGPQQVDDAVLTTFGTDLSALGVINAPRTIHRTACIEWNRAARTFPAWPKQELIIPDNRRAYIIAWDKFAPSLKHDFDQYIARLAGKDLLENRLFRPLRPASVATRARQLHEYLSALVHRGLDPRTFPTLADVVDVATVKQAVRFYLERAGGEPTVQVNSIVGLITAVARHWVKVDAEQLGELKALARLIALPSQGMTAKNRNRLRQFDDPDNTRALVKLPQQIFKENFRIKNTLSRRDALLVQSAVAIELLMMMPMRIANLAHLEIGRHILRGRNGTMQLAVPGSEVKNGTAIEAVLMGETVKLLAFYIDRCRPLLVMQPSCWLFPGKADKPKSTDMLSHQISACVKKRCNLVVNPHLFRHIGAKLYLSANPGGYEVVRLVHGHKSVATTTRFYCGTEGVAAAAHFDEQILKWRGGTGPAGKHRPNRVAKSRQPRSR